MRLLNTNKRIPGGWRYEQFDAAGKLLKRWERDFDPWTMFLAKVQSFRTLNHLIRADIGFVEADVTEYLAREFGGDPKYFTSEPGQKKTSLTSRFQSRNFLARVADRSRQLISGASILSDWLGAGLKPVERALAQTRADICSGRINGVPCPHNNPGFQPVETIAQIIRGWSEQKNAMTLDVIGEDKLHTCGICWCHLPTKVFVPMETILDRTPQAMLDKFASEAPENCWMKTRT